MIALRAEGLGKAYRLYDRPIDSLKELFLRRDYARTFWALRDVTLEVGRGGSLGIIGDNGAGKSTLLRLLAGAVAPTNGRVERVGRTSAMLSLGAGFHPDLSGRENIRIGCAVLGLSPGETEALTPAIIAFSELEEFIDRPVRTYSSGMQLRLGFSVATAVDPDILIVDEHLSVGDQHFRHKCLRRIMQLRERGCTLVFCSHDLYAVGEVCERTLWLRDGQPAMLAATTGVVDAYQDHVRERNGASETPLRQEAAADRERHPPADNHLCEVALGGDVQDGQIETGGRLELRITARVAERARREGVHVGVLLVRNDAVWCYGTSTKMDGVTPLYPLPNGEWGVCFIVDPLPLLAGQYSFTIGLMDATTPHMYDAWPAAVPFTVRHAGQDVGVARLPHAWTAP
jgi:lipopolysaccharide transport system ATP-binding protein